MSADAGNARVNTVRARLLERLRSLAPHEALTATELARMIRARPDNTSSALSRLVKAKVLVRIPNFGPRGGNGYRIMTAEEHLTRKMELEAAEELAEQIDSQVLDLFDVLGSA